MSDSSKTPTIAEAARDCFVAFEHILDGAARLHPQDQALIENQLARFSLWGSAIGVFAMGRASTDYRLREAPEVSIAVVGILQALSDHVRDCQKTFATSLIGTVKGLDGSIFERRIRDIDRAITLLHNLLNTVRKASKESQNLKAAKTFSMKDADGNDLEPIFRRHFAANLHDQFPGMSDIIVERLASSMVLRRKRILYKRHRYGKTAAKLPIRVPQPQIKSTPTPPQPSPKPVRVPMKQKSLETPAASGHGKTKSAVVSEAPTATTLDADKFKRASTPSVVSAARTVPLDKDTQLIFPPPPRAQSSKATANDSTQTMRRGQRGDRWTSALNREVICPLCFCTMPEKDARDERKWREHVLYDLDPYVCLFESCDAPSELFNHSETWLSHMRKHTLTWRCTAKSHPTALTFDRRDDYETHMRDAHPRQLTSNQLRLLADRSALAADPLLESCPFCGLENPDGRLEDHVVGHLRFLALKSLPLLSGDDDDEPGADGDEGERSDQAKPQTRSTIKLESEACGEIAFPSDERPRMLLSKEADDPDAHSFVAWGDQQGYLSKYPQGALASEMDLDIYKYLETYNERFGPPRVNLIRFRNEVRPSHPLDETETNTWGSRDPSIAYVDLNIFEDVVDAAAKIRAFEWGFALPAIKDEDAGPPLTLRDYSTSFNLVVSPPDDPTPPHIPPPSAPLNLREGSNPDQDWEIWED